MTRKLMTLIFAVAVLASCRGREAALTSSYGDRVISGQIVLGEGVADSSPAGVQVSVVGTGMSTTLGADGKFAFAGVPDGAELQISRADGISARTPATSGVLQVTPNGVTGGRGRGPKKTEPQNQYEGVLTKDGAVDSLTILDSHKQTVTIALTPATLIRRGDKIVAATDLKAGDQVHVQATMVKDVLTASLVVVQNEDGQGNGQEQQFEGVLTKDGAADSLTLLDSHGQTDKVAITSSTVIRKGNTTVAATDLKSGDHVHVKAAMVGGVLTATEVIVQGGSDGSGDDQGGDSTMTANGPVKAVDGTTLTVTSQPNGDVTVKTDDKTIIRQQGAIIHVSDIKVGYEVNTMGTRVDNHTLLATQIEVRGTSKH